MSMYFTMFVKIEKLLRFLSTSKYFLMIKTFCISEQINDITYIDTFQQFWVGLDDY